MAEQPPRTYDAGTTLYPWWSAFLERVQLACGLIGAGTALAGHELERLSIWLGGWLAAIVMLSLAIPAIIQVVRYLWSRTRSSFLRDNRMDLAFSAVWLGGLALVPAFAHSAGWISAETDIGDVILGWSELLAIARGLHEIYLTIHQAADAGLNPALVLVVSFAALIAAGTVLLMLPRCRPDGESPAPFLTALFTATSAGCVTGLTVVPTGSYWSNTGHAVILALIQFGGLGIMSFSAFFAMALGRKLPVREQITFRELLESDRLGDVGSLIRAIFGFTMVIELIGALLLTTLWSDLPWKERLFHGVFHSVSAFCNAGFSLRDENLLGWELKWQVWGVIATLIILGGFGFPVLNNWRRVFVYSVFHRTQFGANVQGPRLSLHTRLATTTSIALLLGGTLCLFALECNNPKTTASWDAQLANAWFHSVTLRTAGFNTLDHEQLLPVTKLLSIGLMFVGASPGSTGGGVKTITLALTLLTLRAILRGRPAVEVSGRTIPDEQVSRGLAIITLGMLTLMLSSLLIVWIEDRPDRLVDQLYEAASAFGTVGVSANLTPTLQPASQAVLIATMFFGRVGPLTLIVALAGSNRPRGYAYPEERVGLG